MSEVGVRIARRDARSDHDCVSSLAVLAAGAAAFDELKVGRALEDEGYPRDQWLDAIRFTPLAIGRRALQGRAARCCPRYFEMSPDGAVLRHGVVAENGLFIAAWELAPTFDAAAVRRLVLRSAELRAFMEATAQGEPAGIIALAPTIFFSALPTRAGMQRAQALADAWRHR